MAEKVPTKDASESFIYKAKDLTEANALRAFLLKNSSRLWLFVYTETCTIAASNSNGGKLSESNVALLRDACKRFLAQRGEEQIVEPESKEDDDFVVSVGKLRP